MEDFKIGDVILDKYEVTGILGKGGMGLVLEARHRALGELVALKFLLPSLRDRADLAVRFADEARSAIRIKNEHVARVYDVGSVDGVPFMVMEHLTGQDLAAVIRRRGPLPIAESADLLLQACEAIAEAHTLRIIHRDLKPANLFVTTTSDGMPFVKVLDFGISKSSSPGDVSATASTTVLGTASYMSPEQLASTRSVDARSDVWSLGVILYEMLAGKRLFPGDSFAVVCAAVLHGTHAKLGDHREDIPPLLEQMLSETLALDREVRLASVEAFAARLAPFGTEAGRASHARIRRLVLRTGAPSELAASSADSDASTPSVGAGEPTAPGPPTTGVPVSHVQDEPPPRRRVPRVALGVVAVAVVAVGFAVVLPRVGRMLRGTSAASSVGAGVDPMQRETGTANPGGCIPGAPAACEAACAANDPQSCYVLAKMLAKGTGVVQDSARAATLYQSACDGGVLAACNNLGAAYAAGDGVVRDQAKAVAEYERACDGGYGTACVNLGAMHFEGNGVPKNESLGARFFLRGCEAGEPLGCLDVSIAYGEGQGVPKDAGRSVTFAERACAGGALRGCVRVGLAKIAGDGVAKDVKAGLAELDAMCTRGEPLACGSLVKLYAKGAGVDVPADSLRVREYAKKACDLGDKLRCDVDKVLGTTDSAESMTAQGNALFQAKCNAGSLAECELLGENLVAGIGVSVDRARGIALLERACAGGLDRACKKLAEERTRGAR